MRITDLKNTVNLSKKISDLINSKNKIYCGRIKKITVMDAFIWRLLFGDYYMDKKI